jgi:hypothetical protein
MTDPTDTHVLHIRTMTDQLIDLAGHVEDSLALARQHGVSGDARALQQLEAMARVTDALVTMTERLVPVIERTHAAIGELKALHAARASKEN